MDQRQVLAEVERRVGYLHGEPWRPEGVGWVVADAVVSGAAPEVELALAESAAGVGGGSRVVGASLFVQSYAFEVVAIPLVAHALGLPAPRARPGLVAVHLAGGRATGVSYRPAPPSEGPVDPGATDELVVELLEGHLLPLLVTVRRRVRIGERLLWGNVASACATALRAVEGAARARGDLAEERELRLRAGEFFAEARHRLRGTGSFEGPPVAAGRGPEGDLGGWRWQRANCCLWYRASGEQCSDCSLRPR